jgi:hypothetical protein
MPKYWRFKLGKGKGIEDKSEKRASGEVSGTAMVRRRQEDLPEDLVEVKMVRIRVRRKQTDFLKTWWR